MIFPFSSFGYVLGVFNEHNLREIGRSAGICCNSINSDRCCWGLRFRKNEININRSSLATDYGYSHTLAPQPEKGVLMKAVQPFALRIRTFTPHTAIILGTELCVCVCAVDPTYIYTMLTIHRIQNMHTLRRRRGHKTTCPVKHCTQCFVAIVYVFCGLVSVWDMCTSVCVARESKWVGRFCGFTHLQCFTRNDSLLIVAIVYGSPIQRLWQLFFLFAAVLWASTTPCVFIFLTFISFFYMAPDV